MTFLPRFLKQVSPLAMMASTVALCEETPPTAAANEPVIRGEVPEGWEVVADPTGAKVSHRLELSDGEEMDIRVPRMILRPIAKESPTESEKASTKLSAALATQTPHLGNSLGEMQSVLSRIRLLLSQTSNPLELQDE